MAVLYKRNCKNCGIYYEGRGKLCCSNNCFAQFRKSYGGHKDNNRKPDILINLEGENISLKQIAEKYDIPYKTVRMRYFKGKRGSELIKPKRKYRKND